MASASESGLQRPCCPCSVAALQQAVAQHPPAALLGLVRFAASRAPALGPGRGIAARVSGAARSSGASLSLVGSVVHQSVLCAASDAAARLSSSVRVQCWAGRACGLRSQRSAGTERLATSLCGPQLDAQPAFVAAPCRLQDTPLWCVAPCALRSPACSACAAAACSTLAQLWVCWPSSSATQRSHLHTKLSSSELCTSCTQMRIAVGLRRASAFVLCSDACSGRCRVAVIVLQHGC
jgi:hypothetical protein